MRAVVLDGRGSIEVQDGAEPEPGPNDVVVAPESVGICGTDLHLAAGDYPGGAFPAVPGHEFAGTIHAVGGHVTNFAVGDRVDAQITSIDKAARRVALSIKALEMADEKEAIEQFGSSDSGASLGDILGAALREKNAGKD